MSLMGCRFACLNQQITWQRVENISTFCLPERLSLSAVRIKSSPIRTFQPLRGPWAMGSRGSHCWRNNAPGSSTSAFLPQNTGTWTSRSETLRYWLCNSQNHKGLFFFSSKQRAKFSKNNFKIELTGGGKREPPGVLSTYVSWSEQVGNTGFLHFMFLIFQCKSLETAVGGGDG